MAISHLIPTAQFATIDDWQFPDWLICGVNPVMREIKGSARSAREPRISLGVAIPLTYELRGKLALFTCHYPRSAKCPLLKRKKYGSARICRISGRNCWRSAFVGLWLVRAGDRRCAPATGWCGHSGAPGRTVVLRTGRFYAWHPGCANSCPCRRVSRDHELPRRKLRQEGRFAVYHRRSTLPGQAGRGTESACYSTNKAGESAERSGAYQTAGRNRCRQSAGPR